MDWSQFKPDKPTAPDPGGEWANFVPDNPGFRESRGLTDYLRDAAAATLKIGPTAAKGIGDIAQLATAGLVGGGLSGAMQQGMQSIDEVVGSPILRAEKAAVSDAINDPSQGVTDVIAALFRNPGAAADMGVATVGSMALPLGAVGLAGRLAKAPLTAKAATGVAVGTGAVQNAAETFTGTDAGMGGRYGAAALSGGASLALGKLFGGGLEGLIARRMAGQPSASSGLRAIFGPMMREGGQEFGEEGSNALAQNIGEGQPLDLNQAAKQGTVGGILGAVLGGVGGASGSPSTQEQAAAFEEAIKNFKSADTAPVAPERPNPEQYKRLLEHANQRAATLKEKANGTQDQTINGPDGKLITTPGKPAEFLTDQEKAELEFLEEFGDDVHALAYLYKPADPVEASPEAAPEVQSPPAAVEQQPAKPVDDWRAFVPHPPDIRRAQEARRSTPNDFAETIGGQDVQVRGGQRAEQAILRPVPRELHAGVAQDAPPERGGANENARPELRQLGTTQGETDTAAMREVPSIAGTEASRQLQPAAGGEVDVQGVPPGRAPSPQPATGSNVAATPVPRETPAAPQISAADQATYTRAAKEFNAMVPQLKAAREAGNSVEVTRLTDAMRILGFSDQEISDATTQGPAAATQDRTGGGAPGQDGARAAQGAPAADPGSAPGQQPEQAEGLSSYTAQELRERDQRIADQAKAEANKQADQDAKAAADSQRAEFSLTGSDRAADANPDQGDIFSTPSTPAEPAAPPVKKQPAPKPPAVQDLVDLRKRLSVLRALKECLA